VGVTAGSREVLGRKHMTRDNNDIIIIIIFIIIINVECESKGDTSNNNWGFVSKLSFTVSIIQICLSYDGLA
jgi:hypothetical protein